MQFSQFLLVPLLRRGANLSDRPRRLLGLAAQRSGEGHPSRSLLGEGASEEYPSAVLGTTVRFVRDIRQLAEGYRSAGRGLSVSQLRAIGQAAKGYCFAA